MPATNSQQSLNRQKRKDIMRLFPLIFATITLISGCGSSVKDGIAAYEKQDYITARKIFEQHSHDKDAQYYLAEMHRYGSGVSKNIDAAVSLYKAAESQGQTDALYAHGQLLVKGEEVPRDVESGLSLLQRAGEAGEARAYEEIGNFYASAKGGGRGLLARDAYMKGPTSILTLRRLALLYERGTDDLPTMPNQARATMEKALANPDPRYPGLTLAVAADLAEYYFYGFGGPREGEKARDILAKYPSDNGADFLAWMKYQDTSAQNNQLEAVTVWQAMIDEARRTRRTSPKYAELGLVIAYHTGIGAPQLPLRAAAYKAQIIPISGLEYLMPALAARGLIPGGCDEPLRADDHPGRYRGLMVTAYEMIITCLQARREPVSAYLVARQARLHGIGSAATWQMEIRKSMNAKQAASAAMLEAALSGSSPSSRGIHENIPPSRRRADRTRSIVSGS
ncbi:tetratricopeptide repeat protein [Cupriavidus necator]|nr:tetratricopeptide repeat protein [Cupriavidus necator]MDX6013427.1 tetratricopeptide repeat protein [Cupriavidus necator]